MRAFRRHREFLAWLMSVAVTCNIILAMFCCAPIARLHQAGAGAGELGAIVLCTASGLKSLNADGSIPQGHKPLHSHCVMCSHGPGVALLPPPADAGTALPTVSAGGPVVGIAAAALAPSYFAFAEPTSRGPPRA